MDDDPTELELARVRRRVREHRRRELLAKSVAVGVTLVFFVLGFVVDFALGIRRAEWAGLFVGGAIGRFLWVRLEPRESIDDL